MFFTYLYYPVVSGLPKVADKAYLVSTAHDEPPFYFARTYAPLFHSLRGIIFLSRGEADLVNRIYKLPPRVKQIMGGYGVPKPEVLTAADEAACREKFASILTGPPFFLYLGRASTTKRCQELVHAHITTLADYRLQTKVVFAGTMDFDLPKERKEVVSVGIVSAKEKTFLLRHAIALVNPSALESLSMVILEAWMHGTPVIVNGSSTVMREHCIRANGGLFYESEAMFRGLLAWAAAHTYEGAILGRMGHAYVQENFNWSNVTETLLREVT